MPIVLGLSSIDYGVLAIYLLLMIGVGVYFSNEQHTSKDFFLAGRSMGWFAVGLSIMATLLSALSYSGVPGEAYYVGLKFLWMPLTVWVSVPLLAYVVLPLYRRLELYSIYSYLEMRYDAATRFLSSALFVVWRLLWLGGVLYAPCKVLIVAAGLEIPMWWLLLILGLVSTFYTFLGGMKAVIWTDVIQAIIMAGGLLLIIGGVWWDLDGGPSRVWQVAEHFGRAQMADTHFDWSVKWSIWGIAPHFVLAMLSFYVADQITVQRYLTAKSLSVARRSFVMNCVSVSLMIPALMYAGMALLAFYHDNPQAMRPIWVANVQADGKPVLDSLGQPLLAWSQSAITPENIKQLVAEQRLLRPNTKQPFADARELLRTENGHTVVDIERLAMHKPPPDGEQRGEIILNQLAKDELLPHFITTQLHRGLAGLILAALLAASMSSMDSGLNSICTLLITDFHRRLGIGRGLLARWVKKDVSELNEADELLIGRPLVLIIGVAATMFSLFIAQIDDIFTIMIAVVNTFGGPLLAVFLLGMFSRRTTSAGAIGALLLGTLFTLWLMVANSYPSMSWLWPWQQKLHGIWPLSFGVVFSLIVGYGLSFFLGRPPDRERLRGLVVGIGQLGVRDPEEAALAIPDSFPGVDD